MLGEGGLDKFLEESKAGVGKSLGRKSQGEKGKFLWYLRRVGG